MEIATYYGGARCGWVMVPTSSNWSGWHLFTKELDSFLAGSNTVWVKGRTSDEAAAGGPLDGGGQVGKKSVKISNQRKFRNFEFSRANSGHNVLKGDTVVAVSSINGRPMHKFKFELRVSKLAGGKRVATWMNPNTHHKSNNSGPGLLKIVSRLDKAHVADPRGKAQGEVSYPLDLCMSVLCFQNESVMGESSKPLMESTVMPEVSMAVLLLISNSDQASKLLTSIPTRALADPEIGKASTSRRSSAAVVLDIDKAVSAMGSVSDAEVTHGLGNQDPGFTCDRVVSLAKAAIEASCWNVELSILGWNPWVVQNWFSPLFDLGNGIEDEFVEGEVHGEVQRSNHHDDTTLQRSMDSIGEFQTDSRLHLLPWETSEVFDHSCGRGERFLCVGV